TDITTFANSSQQDKVVGTGLPPPASRAPDLKMLLPVDTPSGAPRTIGISFQLRFSNKLSCNLDVQSNADRNRSIYSRTSFLLENGTTLYWRRPALSPNYPRG